MPNTHLIPNYLSINNQQYYTSGIHFKLFFLASGVKSLSFVFPSDRNDYYLLRGMSFINNMKQFLAITFTSALLVLGLGEVTQAAVLGTEDLSTAGGRADIVKDYQLQLTVGSALDRYPANAPMFNGFKVTPSDVGRTFTVTEATDSNFNDFVAYLTDGEPDGISLSLGTGSLGSVGAGLGIGGNLFGGNPDLAGNKINSIGIRINSFTLDTPGINPNNDGVWTDESFDATLIVEGEPSDQNSGTPVPEPTSMLGVLAFGAFGSSLLFKRKLQFKP